MTFADEVTADSPELWWDTRQASGASQPDRSGNGHTGTITGSPTLDADGLTFDTPGQIIESANIAPITYATFALEAVVRPDVLTPYYGAIVSLFEPTGQGVLGINVQEANDTSDLTYNTQTGDTDDYVLVYDNPPNGAEVAAGLQHLLLDFDGADLTLYLDGAVYGTKSVTPFDVDFTEAAPFTLGDDIFGPEGFLGLVRHGIFYDHDLGPTRAGVHATAALGNDPADGDPTVTNVSPNSGTEDGGTSVTITGTNLTGATEVFFGEEPAASFTVVDDTTITATTPAHFHISVHVTVVNPAGTSATSGDDIFTFTGDTPAAPDPVTIRVVETDGTVITNLTLARVESITRTKNQPDEAIIVFPKHAYTRNQVHVFADDSGTGDLHEIQVVRNSIVRFWGPAVSADTDSATGEVTLHCRGVDWYLWTGRYLDGQRDNEFTNPSFETGDETGWADVGALTSTVTTDDAIRGTYSLRLASSTNLGDIYKEQTVSITGTGVGTFITVVFYFLLESITGHALDRRGLYVEALDGAALQVNNYYPIDEATPTGEWIRAKTTIAVPADTTWDINVRLYSPPGSILWDDGQMVAMQSISTATITGNTFEPVDVSEIVELILNHVKAKGTDLNIALTNPTVGVRQVKHIQWADHISWADQMAEWLDRDDCFDYSMVYTTTTRTLTLHVPQQGVDRRGDFTFTYPGNVASHRFNEDGGGTITESTQLDQDTGDGPDREEGHYQDASLVGGLILQTIDTAPPKSEPSSLDPLARERVNRARRPAQLLALTVVDGATVWSELVGLGDACDFDITDGWATTDGFGRISQLVENPHRPTLEVTFAKATP